MRYESSDATISNGKSERADFVGCLLRFAGHDFMDFRKNEANQGGSDGCMHFDDPDNAGLKPCLTKIGLPDVYRKWSDKVSLADFIVISAEAAIGRVATDNFDYAYAQEDGTQDKNYFRQGTFAQ